MCTATAVTVSHADRDPMAEQQEPYTEVVMAGAVVAYAAMVVGALACRSRVHDEPLFWRSEATARFLRLYGEGLGLP